MYCANCGVKLADSEKVCPLCKTVAYHPDIKREISVALRDIKDGRVANGLVSVSHCEVTSDLSYCKVYISSLEGGERTEAIWNGWTNSFATAAWEVAVR